MTGAAAFNSSRNEVLKWRITEEKTVGSRWQHEWRVLAVFGKMNEVNSWIFGEDRTLSEPAAWRRWWWCGKIQQFSPPPVTMAIYFTGKSKSEQDDYKYKPKRQKRVEFILIQKQLPGHRQYLWISVFFVLIKSDFETLYEIISGGNQCNSVEHMAALAPGAAYVQGYDLLPSSGGQHARTKLQRRSDRVAPGSWLTFANLCCFSWTSDTHNVSRGESPP